MIMMSVGQALTAAAAATVAASFVFARMDANPSLYVYDLVWMNPQRLKRRMDGQRIWITGASSGIGASLAQQLAAAGAHLILSSRPSERLEAVARNCRHVSPHNSDVICVLPIDVTCTQDELDNAVHRAGPVDCVILNAGQGQLLPAIETSSETSAQLMQVNALAPMAMAMTMLRNGDWVSKQRGHFVVTSSVAAKFAVPLSASYAASKHAVHGYFQSLHAECPWLRIDLPCPGPVATEFHISRPTTTTTTTTTLTSGGSARELKMPVDRCSRLILSSMMMGRHGGETWIAQQPTLFFCFLNQCLPGVAAMVLRKVGPIRMGLWEAGFNLYDPQSFSKFRTFQRTDKNTVKNRVVAAETKRD